VNKPDGRYSRVTEDQATKSVRPPFFSPGSTRLRDIGAIVVALLSGSGFSLVVRPDTATSAEVQTLKTELAAARTQLSESKVTELSGKLDTLSTQVTAWQKQREADNARDVRQDEQIVFLAEFASALNSGPPGRGFPHASERDWYEPRTPPPMNKTDRVWPGSL
jgi:hypothetical protein